MRAMKPLRSCLQAVSAGATCLLLAACAGGQAQTAREATSGVAHDAASTVSSARGAVAARPPSHTQALAFARAVNLSAADVPEASVEARHRPTETVSEHREERACETRAGWGHPRTLAEASSPKLERGRELEIERMTSTVSVLRDERAVARQFALLASPALRKCAARVLTRNLDDKSIRDARWGRVTVSKLPIDAPGATATVGIRIVVALEIPFNEVSIPIYVDVLGFAIGRAEVALSAMSATQPVPAATERELVSLLLARARAHPL
jgi:hypothetical protein